MSYSSVVLSPDCSLEAPGSRGAIKLFLPPPHGSPVQPRLKGTQGFGVMLLQGFKSVVLHLGCILEPAEFFLKHQCLGLIPSNDPDLISLGWG